MTRTRKIYRKIEYNLLTSIRTAPLRDYGKIAQGLVQI